MAPPQDRQPPLRGQRKVLPELLLLRRQLATALQREFDWDG